MFPVVGLKVISLSIKYHTLHVINSGKANTMEEANTGIIHKYVITFVTPPLQTWYSAASLYAIFLLDICTIIYGAMAHSEAVAKGVFMHGSR